MLIIEDDPFIQKTLVRHFKSVSFAVDATDCGEQGCYLGKVNDYDIIILDHFLPKKTGYEITKQLRAQGKTTPIIMITVQSSIPEKVTALNAGVDDYVTKPFSLEEVHARVHALLRRPSELRSPILSVANLKIDVHRQSVIRGKQKIYLTRKEFALLEYLARNKGIVISRSMLLEHVWDGESDPFSNTIEAHILNLRKKVDVGHKKLIKTVPGRGYTLDSVN